MQKQASITLFAFILSIAFSTSSFALVNRIDTQRAGGASSGGNGGSEMALAVECVEQHYAGNAFGSSGKDVYGLSRLCNLSMLEASCIDQALQGSGINEDALNPFVFATFACLPHP